MSGRACASVSTSVLLLVTALNLGAAQAQQPVTRYPHMAPLEDYMAADENAEIALARSAAPAAISDGATIEVLKQRGYETAVQGKNGFVCIVERSWMSPFDWPEFWNPKMRGPICFNPPAVRSVLPFTYKRTEMILAGLSKAEIIDRLKAAVGRNEVPALEAGAMCYMMSPQAMLGDSPGHWHPHLMFYGPRSNGSDWGSDLPGSPVLLNPQFQNSPEPLTTFVVAVDRWSDGSSAPIHGQ